MHRPRHTLAAPLATLSAAAVALSMTAAATPASALTAAPSATGPIHYDDGAVALPISPQAQEQSNWCWAATGGTIAAYAGRVPAAGGATPRVVAGTTTEVHVLARDFVAEGTGPVGDLGYVATTARVDEQLVSVWTTRTKGGAWRAVNAATGDVEASMARRAGSAALLSEPQVGAWYAVTNDRVRPLNGEARKVVGGGMSLEDYQQVVHERYADKLPGSDYDESGAAGGFESASAPVTTPGDDAPPRSGVLAGIGGIGLLAAGLLVRRQRSHT
ncbi:hypothetical protein [Janibacter sp. G368]|uniref:hypothetical protein n=1 Tax=Janibacter sp. G368 TaxID=3420441 RepID=UPI003D01DD2C